MCRTCYGSSGVMGTRGVEGAYQGALRAFQNPMLALLHHTHAPFVVTVLAMVFTAERPRVPVADSHAEVLTAQRQASRLITCQIRNHDPMRDRQVDDLLRDVDRGSLSRPSAPPVLTTRTASWPVTCGIRLSELPAEADELVAALRTLEESQDPAPAPELLSALPFTGPDLVRISDARALFDAFRLEITYDRPTHRPVPGDPHRRHPAEGGRSGRR